MTTMFQGLSKPLAILSGTSSLRLQCSNQKWKITKTGYDSYYRIQNSAAPGKSLDIINDANDNKLIMATTGAYTGQYWKLTKTKLIT